MAGMGLAFSNLGPRSHGKRSKGMEVTNKREQTKELELSIEERKHADHQTKGNKSGPAHIRQKPQDVRARQRQGQDRKKSHQKGFSKGDGHSERALAFLCGE